MSAGDTHETATFRHRDPDCERMHRDAPVSGMPETVRAHLDLIAKLGPVIA
jgi:RNA polymerase sigma-70 factor (ECF subfamily)